MLSPSRRGLKQTIVLRDDPTSFCYDVVPFAKGTETKVLGIDKNVRSGYDVVPFSIASKVARPQGALTTISASILPWLNF
jgi:hypothetical protein